MKTNRNEIVDAALRLFSSQGYRETSIGDIEDAAGLTRRAGGFYRHFPSKEAVLFESVRQMASRMIAEIRLDDILAQGGVRKELLFVARRLLEHAKEYRAFRLLLQREADRVPGLRDVIREVNTSLAQQDVVPWVAYALRRAGRRGDAQAYAFLVISPIVAHMVAQDRGQPTFGLTEKQAIDSWTDYWAKELAPRTKPQAASKRTTSHKP